MADVSRQPSNPVIDLYGRQTKQYLMDAVEAEKAAKMYAKMAAAVVPKAVKTAAVLTTQEMSRIDMPTWAHAAWEFEKMLTNPLPAKAAAAAAKAAAPIDATAAAYVKSEKIYDQASQDYATRVGMDEALAKQLATYANQYRLQGDKVLANTYAEQSTLLMNQADTFAKISQKYNKMANKIKDVVPVIQDMAGMHGASAAWKVDPDNTLPLEHVFPFTPVPPIEFVQTDSTLSELPTFLRR